MKSNLVIFIHGKGGNAGEAEGYRKYFPGMEIYGFDYKSSLPWDAKKEFYEKVKALSENYDKLILVASSLGAYFSLIAGIDSFISRAFFIAPIVNMERLVVDMIGWAGTTEEELKVRKVIPVDFGDDLSWEYLQFVRNCKIQWNVPTEILYGNLDNLQSLKTMKEFAQKTGAGLTVLEGSEHWIHTEEQIKFLDEWLLKVSCNIADL